MLGLNTCWRGQALNNATLFLRRSMTTALASRPTSSKVPMPNDTIKTPSDFLKAIGRSSETKVKIEDWEEFWHASGLTFKAQGLAIRDRRYILWCMERYRQALDISTFAHPPKPPKKYRGWGARFQKGKRIW
ncbi:hypothetical protein FIBSPDRAFT_925705 [Athelia psychrophila]|uniref:Small ribosomal subunit protein mS41 n=1 Tax=Athelia psychrophila TaxID=1759441 RepID=A0A166U8R3_9AGAM|nr:hypothetical protein FIBSPDRAFT_925705 [Fibularhizoctonia sp. CBS 109695]